LKYLSVSGYRAFPPQSLATIQLSASQLPLDIMGMLVVRPIVQTLSLMVKIPVITDPSIMVLNLSKNKKTAGRSLPAVKNVNLPHC
jgi:hypothetical protein